MIPLIKESVEKLSLATNEELLEFIGISESTPGPFAINISTFIGFKNGNFIGSVLSTLGVVLPSFVIIILISKFFNRFKENEILKYVLQNLKPIILALLVYSIINISIKLFLNGNSINISNIILFLVLLFTNIKFKFSPIILILFSGILGIIFL